MLLIAEAANPEWTSVPLIGWNLSRALSKYVDTHIVTQVRNRDALLRHGLTEGVHFTAIDSERIASPLTKIAERLRGGDGKGWTMISAFSALSYYSFERKLWEKFRDRLASREFDVVHRITPLSPTNASLIAKHLARLNIPFVLGPLNGGVPWPPGFRRRQHSEKEWLAYVRDLYKLMPGYASTRRNSSAILVGSRYTQSELPGWAVKSSTYLPENGVDEKVFHTPRSPGAVLPLTAVFVGRLVAYKGADIAIAATSRFLRAGHLRLQIIGDGPERGRLEEQVRSSGLEDKVKFWGWLTQAELQEKLRTCDLLTFPSIREFGGGVVLESMALGVAPIVADYAGPSELVDEDTGIRVPFVDEATLIQGFERAIQRIVNEPQLLDRLGAAAREKVLTEFTWDAKAMKIVEVYRSILSRTRIE
ncbi:glycosyltransferase family 1 protein [Bradyrhizobium guangdongense]|uniref:Glycosyltransferase family 1 protein n=1 Tax=Bradyrhizobium guangdongense TaxID=1325090 RepID=A0ABX6UFE8_9BRAD|nr:glycosyltransferase family 1 protein [Bradyrhizobium guangdongense]QOZ59549.1 glycosyltransferase family 1 protein [Bradyrhizobium guangdongense]